MEHANQPRWAEHMAAAADRFIRWGVRHWLAVVNLTFLVYVALPVLAPVFMALGWEGAGKAIYLAYRPFCHQLAERSFFLFGPKATYSLNDLSTLGLPTGTDFGSLWARRLFIGDPSIGYKMAFCQRDLALYGSLLVGGLIFALTRRWLRPLPWKVYILFLLPMALDGGTQLIRLRESTWALRLITGTLAGLATVWALYPRVDEALPREQEVVSNGR